MKASVFALIFLCFTGCVTTPETGRTAFILTSEQDESQLGVQAYAEVLAKEKLSTNPRWTSMLQRIGTRIAQAANKPEFKWEFKLIDSAQQNAFCLPGGKVAVYTGILSVAQNEAGLAAVLGHEVAHATARHGGQRMTVALGSQVGLTAANLMIGGENDTKKSLLLAALGVGVSIGAVLPFSRANESEADEIGLVYAARAGYEPKEAPRFWERFSHAGKSAPPAFLSTHPTDEGRKRALTEQLPRVAPLYERSPKYGLGENF